jgi:putative oxidoreductase
MEGRNMNAGLLLLHGFVGAALAAHALQKLIVFRLAGTTDYLRSLGFRAPRLLAAAVIANELVGGLLVGLGFLLPLGAVLVAATMIVASRTDHRGKGWFITGSGSEYVITNAVIVLALAAVGGGRYSLDSAFGIADTGFGWAIAVAVVSLAAAALVIGALIRRPAPVARAAQAA